MSFLNTGNDYKRWILNFVSINVVTIELVYHATLIFNSTWRKILGKKKKTNIKSVSRYPAILWRNTAILWQKRMKDYQT